MRAPPLHPLTSLRFFAAAAIVVFHLGLERIVPIGVVPALANGVSLFFVLSGFILTYNYPHLRSGIGAFYIARIARVWPVHVATIVVLFLLLPQVALWAAEPRGFPIFLSNLFLLHAWVPQGAYALSFNSVSWSISVELFFYAIFPLALLVKRTWLLAAITAVATIAAAAAMPSPGAEDPFVVNWQHVVLHFPPMRVCEFLAGMATARLFLTRRAGGGGTVAEVGALALALMCVAAADQVKDYGSLGLWISQSASFPAFALLIYVLAIGRGAISAALRHSSLILLGEVSYAMYMVHQLLIRHAVQSKMAEYWPTAATVAFIVFATLALSYVLWLVVEKPARQAIINIARPAAMSRARG